MEPFNIKISTPKQINFREFDEHYRYTDIDLEAMFAMSVDIVDFNGEKYREASDVTAEVESDLMGLFQRCMERLPEGESVVKGFETLIPKAMEAVLSDMEITAKTRIFPESRLHSCPCWMAAFRPHGRPTWRGIPCPQP